jgi:hypothetical protein
MEQFNELKNKICEKKLNNFWLVCGRSDFKPFIGTNKKDIINFISDKSQYYIDKNIAKIILIFRQNINIDELNDGDWVFIIKIAIFNIDDNGKLDSGIGSTWMLVIEYSKKEFIENKFALKELSQMIEMASKSKIVSDLGGISYTTWKSKYNR